MLGARDQGPPALRPREEAPAFSHLRRRLEAELGSGESFSGRTAGTSLPGPLTTSQQHPEDMCRQSAAVASQTQRSISEGGLGAALSSQGVGLAPGFQQARQEVWPIALLWAVGSVGATKVSSHLAHCGGQSLRDPPTPDLLGTLPPPRPLSPQHPWDLWHIALPLVPGGTQQYLRPSSPRR